MKRSVQAKPTPIQNTRVITEDVDSHFLIIFMVQVHPTIPLMPTGFSLTDCVQGELCSHRIGKDLDTLF